MPNPLQPQGVLNRLRGAVAVTNFPQLNISAPFLLKPGISLALEGESTGRIPTMTGAVTSPEPYMLATATCHLNKAQNLAQLYKAQIQLQTVIGDCVVTSDSGRLGTFSLFNCSIQSVSEMAFNGEDAGFVVTIAGYWIINSSLWNFS